MPVHSELQSGIMLWDCIGEEDTDRFSTLSIVATELSRLIDVLDRFLQIYCGAKSTPFVWNTTARNVFPNSVQRIKFIRSVQGKAGFSSNTVFEDDENDRIVTVSKIEFPLNEKDHEGCLTYGRGILLVIPELPSDTAQNIFERFRLAQYPTNPKSIAEILTLNPSLVVGRGYQTEGSVVFQLFAAQLTVQRIATELAGLGVGIKKKT